jgi:peroxiredoxin
LVKSVKIPDYYTMKPTQMKKTILCILAFLPAAIFAQGGRYTIEGTLGTYGPPAKVYLQYKKGNYIVSDSTTITNGKFKLEGNLSDDPLQASLALSPKGTGFDAGEHRNFYLESGVTILNGGKGLSDAIISGTQDNLDNVKLDTALKALNGDYNVLAIKRNTTPPDQQQSDAYKKETNKLLSVIISDRQAVYKKFIRDNPDSYVSLVTLISYAYVADYSDIAPLFDGLSDRVKNTVLGKTFAARLPHIKAVALGAIAPEFKEADTSGSIISLSSFRGKYVLVDFWASWCGPCRQESPNLVKAYNHYKGQNFTILGVSLDQADGKGRWLAAIHKDGLPWTQVSDLKYWDNEAAVMYGVRAIPQNFLIDPNGKIIAKNLRGDDLENKLEELIGKI